MNDQWTPEEIVGASRAQQLIERQFPELKPARVIELGAGWDNWAFLVNDGWVFRFPRRRFALTFLETETAVLPVIAPYLPLSIPVPHFCGEATDEFSWPFVGYRFIEGTTACRADLDSTQRARAAVPIARFLRALHDLPTEKAAACGAGADTLGRLDVEKRCGQILDRLDVIEMKKLFEHVAPLRVLATDTPEGWVAKGATLVHGDMYSRHILVDDTGKPTGVIDWGDVHLGDPAGDLSIAHGFLPPAARDAFREAYGTIEEDDWRMARFRALFSSVNVLVYADDIGDAALLRESRVALGYLLQREDSPT